MRVVAFGMKEEIVLSGGSRVVSIERVERVAAEHRTSAHERPTHYLDGQNGGAGSLSQMRHGAQPELGLRLVVVEDVRPRRDRTAILDGYVGIGLSQRVGPREASSI